MYEVKVDNCPTLPMREGFVIETDAIVATVVAAPAVGQTVVVQLAVPASS